ncbi:lysine--tRNA ligase [Candidatus Giovannonibacteria bacterium RIFCSPLOWO2_02_FULL_45_14]|uniref:Lysine--tRNA ligase n=1 Tax=Candidatus Giovannonibacteria bacterium RIFCSPLOWO2_12_FULL_44_15 TaxID=1798364 RepID=A0A1F5XZI0_9BACT|nr:MAG: lysine--tRNA ligase [Candidatus Giovannonibacteria bacterium RIFCSPHIGHO2_02_FULL_44_31]OGF77090.1 MAG: lysine--tRNA ligase [Candidatus Giovannonibacteria bacterium RIFCSPHIGHO2_12_FULL_44_29]OGF90843.1 MAG: lysine--tRNA ligase [Candidatus Giovannonibacteria bacterium RIFCSPLOWO2_02_FULL_45_14]OGF93269.1 MAG: lysine--tRNA ligase [Candidatus Giovannonibacteria bacterium RIFCSPLOWO2_12_FULL_44_15]
MSLEELRSVRVAKLEKLKKAGINPFPAKVDFPIFEISKIKKDFKKNLRKKGVGIAGRIMAKREHGGSAFLDLYDGTEKLQAFVGRDKIGEKSFKLFSENIDVGDFVAVLGRAFYTKRKEPTIEAVHWQVLAKSLRPLPEKWHGLQDAEERFRKRYLDLLMSPEVRGKFLLRSNIIGEIRVILAKDGFQEVETPMLQSVYGGALAEPFKTHHRMLDFDMYLRIAPELYLKRLLVGGFGKIFEIGRVFRNEGIDVTHNPEFTMLELYAAYWDSEALKEFIAKVLAVLIKKVTKKNSFKFEGHEIKLSGKISSIPFWSVIERYALIIKPENMNREEFMVRAKQFGLSPAPEDTKEKIADEIFKKICRPKLIQPIFVTDHPLAISPLAKELPQSSELVDRFQLVIGGVEVVNGFSELNNPLEQKKRFEFQEALRAGKDKEAHPMDEDYVESLEYGMPPAAGLGIGIDRLAMLLTDTHNIKEVILFPTMKPKE